MPAHTLDPQTLDLQDIDQPQKVASPKLDLQPLNLEELPTQSQSAPPVTLGARRGQSYNPPAPPLPSPAEQLGIKPPDIVPHEPLEVGTFVHPLPGLTLGQPWTPAEEKEIYRPATPQELAPVRAGVEDVLNHPVATAADIATGGLEPTPMPAGGSVVRGAEELTQPGQRGRGALDIAAGATGMATPAMGPAALEAGASVPAAIKLAAGTAAGLGGQKAAGKLGDVLGVSPETKQLLEYLGLWAPQVLGAAASGGGYEALPEEPIPRAAALFRNIIYKAGGNLSKNPTQAEAQQAFRQAMQNLHPDVNPGHEEEAQVLSAAWTALKSGNYFRSSVTGAAPEPQNVPAAQPPQLTGTPAVAVAAPSAAPAQPAGQPPAAAPPAPAAESALNAVAEAKAQHDVLQQAGTQAAEQAKAVQAQRAQAPPEEPPVLGARIAPETLEAVGKGLASIPEEERAQALLDAQDKLSQQLLKRGRVVGPDGKVHRIRNEEQADTTAAKLLNEHAVPAQDRTLQEAAQAAERELTERLKQKPAGAPAEVPVAGNPTEEYPAGKLAQEPESKRDILQPEETPKELNQMAKQTAPEYEVKLKEAMAGVPEAQFERIRPQKNPERLEEKVKEEGQPAETVPDYLAGQISYDSERGKEAAIQAIERSFKVLRKGDLSEKGDPDYHYRHVALQVELPNGLTAELHLIPREVHAANTAEHHAYKAAREAELAGDKETFQAEAAKARATNDEAFAKYRARNGQLDLQELGSEVAAPKFTKGQAVTFTDRAGQQQTGTVAHHNPAMNVVRVAKQGGGTVTVGVRQVRQAEQAAGPQPGEVGTMPARDIKIAPHRFQFKLATDAEGVGSLLKGQNRYNPDLAGVVTVWRDPADGKVYVVNGHHRLELARRTGQPTIAVRHINAQDATEARAIGALQNIAEGRGTPVDAAKFLRDSGISPEELEKKGISMGEATARDGVALSRLSEPIFNRVAQGNLRVGRAVQIGDATPDATEQKAILDLVEKREAKGGKVGDDTLAELIRLVQSSGQTVETTSSLFGQEEVKRSLALEKAEISAYVKQQLSKDKRLFGFVAHENRAAELGRAGNRIDVAASRKISTDAAQAEEVYNKLSARAGPVADALEAAARQMAKGASPNGVKEQAYSAIRSAVSKALAGEQGAGAEGSRQHPEAGRGAAQEAQPSLTQPTNEPALPGMERAAEEQKAAAQEEQGRQLSQQAVAPPESVSKAAGEIERESPLFRESEAGGQKNLFGGDKPDSMTFGLSIPLPNPDVVARAASAVRDLISDESAKVGQSRELEGDLYDLQSQNSADVLRAVRTMKEAPGKPEDYAEIYHYLEDPKVQLDGLQQEVLDKYIEPLRQEATRIYSKLTDGGMPVENYVHRVVKEKGGLLDRMLAGRKVSGGGNVLSKYASATKSRTMMALVNEQSGQRAVVAVKAGRVTQFQKGVATDLGGLRSGLTTKAGLLHERVAPLNQEIRKLQHERKILLETKGRIQSSFQRRKNITEQIDQLERKRDAIINSANPDELKEQVFIDKQGQQWKFAQATTREIEGNTNLRYYHNALASSLVSYLNLRRAERAFDFLEAFKSSPDFENVAMKTGDGTPPDGWRPVQLPQFMGYNFEPHIAEVLNNYATRLHRDPAGVSEKVGQFLRTAIFFNPLIHVPNISVHWAVEKGVSGWLPNQLPRMVRTSLRAVNAVLHQNDDFLQALDAGAPLQSQRFENRKLTQLFFEKLTGELQQDNGLAGKVADAFGYAEPAKLIKAVYDFSGKATWVSNDIAFLQATYEKMERGMPLKQALEETGKHIPTYRLPSRIFDSPALANIMRNPAISMFGAYHYGALRSYGEMVKSALGSGQSAKERAHGLDLMIGLGLLTFLVYPQVDKLLKKLTGDSHAELRRAGASTFLQAAYDVLKGEKTPNEALQQVVTPAIQTKEAAELAFNRDFRTGRKLIDWHEAARDIALQLAHEAGQAVSPVQVGQRALSGKEEAEKVGLGMVGVSFRKHGAEKLAQDIARDNASMEAKTPAEREKGLRFYDLLEAARNRDLNPLRDALKARQVTIEEAKKIIEESRIDPLVAQVKGFHYVDAVRVYNVATPEQKRKLFPVIVEKRRNLLKKHGVEGLREQEAAAQ